MKSILCLIFILTFSLQMVGASDRVEQMIREDAMEALQKISLKKVEIHKKKQQLEQFRTGLQRANRGQIAHLQVGKVNGSLIVVAIVVGTYKIHFPLAMRFLMGNYLSTFGAEQGLIKLDLTSIQKINKDLLKLMGQIEIMENDLDTQARYFCEEDSRHRLCYMDKQNNSR